MAAIQSFPKPRLPQELECIIFEIAARNERGIIPNLMLVARRVREWLEPILFEILLLHPYMGRLPAALRDYYVHFGGRPPSDSQRQHVRHVLFLQDWFTSKLDWMDLTHDCHNIQTLALRSHKNPPLSDLVSMINAPLRTVAPRGLLRLSAILSQLFPDGVDFNHVILQDLTHIEIRDNATTSEFMKCWQEGNNLGCLKKLKYLRFSSQIYLGPSSFNLATKCLEECNSLELLLILDRKNDEIDGILGQIPSIRKKVNRNASSEEVPEDRVVFLDIPDAWPGGWYKNWINEAMGWDNLWTTGERIVEERRRKGLSLADEHRG